MCGKFLHRDFIATGLLLCMAEGVAVAGEPTVKVGTNVYVSKARGTIPHAEVVFSADPTRPQRLLAASMAASQDRAKEDILWSRVNLPVGRTASSPSCRPAGRLGWSLLEPKCRLGYGASTLAAGSWRARLPSSRIASGPHHRRWHPTQAGADTTTGCT